MILGEINALEVVNCVGSIASIAALSVTVYVALRVHRIETSYVRQALLPYHARRLKTHVKTLAMAIRNKDDMEARSILALCRANLADVCNILPDKQRRRLADVQRTADELIRTASGTSLLAGCERFGAMLKGELESLATYEREFKWRRRDV